MYILYSIAEVVRIRISLEGLFVIFRSPSYTISITGNARAFTRSSKLCAHAEQSHTPYHAIAWSMWADYEVEVASALHTRSPKPCTCRTNVRASRIGDTCAGQVCAAWELLVWVDCSNRWLVQAALCGHWTGMFVGDVEHCQTTDRQRSLGEFDGTSAITSTLGWGCHRQ